MSSYMSPELYSSSDSLTLKGSRCDACRAVQFPADSLCGSCASDSTSEIALARQGTVWAWTIQRFAPKPPFEAGDEFSSFIVGYVDLGDVIVESIIVAPQEDVHIGQAVSLTSVRLAGSEPSTTFAFAA